MPRDDGRSGSPLQYQTGDQCLCLANYPWSQGPSSGALSAALVPGPEVAERGV